MQATVCGNAQVCISTEPHARWLKTGAGSDLAALDIQQRHVTPALHAALQQQSHAPEAHLVAQARKLGPSHSVFGGGGGPDVEAVGGRAPGGLVSKHVQGHPVLLLGGPLQGKAGAH